MHVICYIEKLESKQKENETEGPEWRISEESAWDRGTRGMKKHLFMGE